MKRALLLALASLALLAGCDDYDHPATTAPGESQSHAEADRQDLQTLCDAAREMYGDDACPH